MAVQSVEQLPITLAEGAPDHLVDVLTEHVEAISRAGSGIFIPEDEAALSLVQGGAFKNTGWEPVITVSKGVQGYSAFRLEDISRSVLDRRLRGQFTEPEETSYILAGSVVRIGERLLGMITGYRHKQPQLTPGRSLDLAVGYHVTTLRVSMLLGRVRFSLLPEDEARELIIERPKPPKRLPKIESSRLTLDEINKWRTIQHCGACGDEFNCFCRNRGKPPLTVHPLQHPDSSDNKV